MFMPIGNTYMKRRTAPPIKVKPDGPFRLSNSRHRTKLPA
jgi:hypothetical protein